MKKLFFSLCVIFFVNVQAQKPYKFPQDFNPYYNFKPEEAFEKIMARAENKEKGEAMEYFVVDYIFNEQYKFDNNSIYMDWNEVEVYLLKMLNKVLPKDANRQNLDLFIKRSLSPNASASRFGNVFF